MAIIKRLIAALAIKAKSVHELPQLQSLHLFLHKKSLHLPSLCGPHVQNFLLFVWKFVLRFSGRDREDVGSWGRTLLPLSLPMHFARTSDR